MKEVTYEDWQKNPTPRMMWVWDNDEERMEKLKVIYILSEEEAPVSDYRVIALTMEHNYVVRRYAHCAEIEEPKTRRMTNKELSWWLSEKPHRELKMGDYIYHDYDYKENEQDEEVTDFLLIREDHGEWREPLVEGIQKMKENNSGKIKMK